MSQGTIGFPILGNDVTIGGANLTAFNDLITCQLTPVLQLDFVYGINTQTGISSVVTTGVADTNDVRLRLQSGTSSTGNATFRSKRPARYRPGAALVCRFTPVFNTPAANSTQIIGVGDTVNGYFFGYNGTTFGIFHRNRSADTFIAQSTWNGDVCDGTGSSGFNWNTSFGVPVQISYGYLGYGAAVFYVMNPTNGRWILVHTIRYPDTTNITVHSNPSLPFFASVTNTGNTSNLTIFCGSVGFFIGGVRTFITNPKWGTDNAKTTITTETNILTLKNCTTYNTITNKGLIELTSLSIGSSADKALVNVRLKLNATEGGSPSFSTINGTTADNGVTITSGNSITSKDTAGTTVTGGLLIFSTALTGVGSIIVDLSPYNLFIAPTETLTISGAATAAADIAVAINWVEDI